VAAHGLAKVAGTADLRALWALALERRGQRPGSCWSICWDCTPLSASAAGFGLSKPNPAAD